MDKTVNMNTILEKFPIAIPGSVKTISIVLIFIGIVGLIIGFMQNAVYGWTSLYVNISYFIGLAIFGAVLSALFQVTRAKWGRSYRRFGEAFSGLMPVGLICLLFLLIGVGHYLPWPEKHLTGGKAIWLIRGFWDVRLLLCLGISYGLGLLLLYYSVRRDFCVEGIRDRYSSVVGKFIAKGIIEPENERERCNKKLSLLSPVVLIVYAICFSFIGFDLIMALDPEWFSTLFGAWYFFGHLFAGLALLLIVSPILSSRFDLQDFFPTSKQRDMATLLFAFCLVNIDFFWSQYLTIWYGNLPEETHYIISRTIDTTLPWRNLSWLTLSAIFLIPFVGLLFRGIKQSRLFSSVVAFVVMLGVYLVRFIEIVPAFITIETGSGFGTVLPLLITSIMVGCGFIGMFWYLFWFILTNVPVLPVGDDLLWQSYYEEKKH